jgi:hypothetical protein
MWSQTGDLLQEGFELEGEPLAFGQLSVEV